MKIQAISTKTVPELQASVLELIASDASLEVVLTHLCELVEGIADGGICSVMTYDPELSGLSVAAAPRAKPELIRALNGLVPGDSAASCGTAFHRKESVFVVDTGVDERWESCRSIAERFGIRACWSVPVLSSDQEALGTIAISQKEARSPDDEHIRLLQTASQLASIAIERSRSRQKLEEAAHKYQDLYDNAPDMCVSVEAKTTHIVECNQTLLDGTGYTRDELMGRSVDELYHPSSYSRLLAARARLLEDGHAEEENLQLVRKDGTTIDVNLKATSLRSQDGKVLFSRTIWRDVTEKNLAEEAIQRAQKLESLGILAGGIAHDFNNLLVGIMGNAELASMTLGEGSDSHKHIEDVLSSCLLARDLTEQLMAYAGKGSLSAQALEISSLAQDTLELIRSSLARRVSLEALFEDPSPCVFGDATQLRQVMMNLITNACEAVGEQGGQVILRTGTVRPDAEYLAGCAIPLQTECTEFAFFEVEDDGEGIDSNTRQRIFDPFFTTKESGHGLGLAATLGIVRTHGGTLHMDSMPTQGSLFRVLLPLCSSVPRVLTPAKARPAAAQRGAHVLVIDDDSTVRDVAAKMLATRGCRVTKAAGGEQALELLRGQPQVLFDSVLLDLTMPGMGGEEVFGHIRQLRSTLPVIFYSGHSSEQDVQRLQAGKDNVAFLSKPFSISALTEALHQVLGSSSSL